VGLEAKLFYFEITRDSKSPPDQSKEEWGPKTPPYLFIKGVSFSITRDPKITWELKTPPFFVC
jgi:hypothetical protein